MNAVNELEIYVQAVWRLSVRSLATSLGLNKTCWGKKRRGRSQARFQPNQRTAKPQAASHTQVAQKVSGVETGKVDNVPAPLGLQTGTLTEIRSIAYLNGQERDLPRDLQQGLRQMLPALAGFCQHRWLVLMAPPCLPTAEELSAAGINPARVLRIHPGAKNGLDILEQTLRSGTCGAVLAWLERGDAQTLDRLRLAAEAGHSWGVLFRAEKQGNRTWASAPQATENAQLKMAIS